VAPRQGSSIGPGVDDALDEVDRAFYQSVREAQDAAQKTPTPDPAAQ
jgi:hypothetical protein